MKKKILILLILLTLGIISLGVIYVGDEMKTTQIGVILNDARKFEGKQVTVSGYVSNSFSLWVKYFVINDGTGELYVIPKNAVPKEGQEVKIKGIFNQRLMIGDKQVATITEQ